MKTLIVMSHGKMAEAALASAEMIVGKIESAYSISMSEDDSPEMIRTRLTAIIDNCPDTAEFIVVVDILGGTPCNVAVAVAKEKQNVMVLSGLSLGMIIEFCVVRHEMGENVKEKMIHSAKQGIEDVLSFFNKDSEE